MSAMKRNSTGKALHLVCNAHLDPAWLWEWPEGAAEAMSTFRIAADLCEEFDGFVFNHNEAILYQWVEEYEPALFRRIERLVRRGRWHIMGGWFLQPDCNMPSGESFVRQILWGRAYFKAKFGAVPTTAINMDPFGHTRGLVQILRKAGYDSYLVCRPNPTELELPADDVRWVGFDGSEIHLHRERGAYGSALGQARAKVEKWLADHPQEQTGLVLWGVGNHGGGPSRTDLRQLTALIRRTRDRQILHSTPEGFFAAMAGNKASLPRVEKDLQPSMVGCYTSQIRVKQKHRQLENALYRAEKMMSHAALQGRLDYPRAELREVLRDLLFSEFHDLLPGSSIGTVEDGALRLMDHGLEILSRLQTRAFFALAGGQPKAKENEIPILVYNPHPFPVTTTVECEFQPANQNWKDEFNFPAVYRGGKPVACQAEKEESNITLDWRKRSVFRAELAPLQMNRFDVRLRVLPRKPAPQLKPRNNKLTFRTRDLTVVVNCRTGLVDDYRIGGTSYLKTGAFCPLVVRDDADPWAMRVRGFSKVEAPFRLMSKAQAARFAGIDGRELAPVRVIEDGAVRTVIEALFIAENSFICQRYKLPKQGTEIEVEVRVFWNEKSRMLKWSVPTPWIDSEYLGQTAYGLATLPNQGDEAVAQKWTAVVSTDRALTCINEGVYGSDCRQGELRMSLLRSPAYSAHPIEGRPLIPQDRFMPRIDQGERVFRFWLNGGKRRERLLHVDREALVHNERPVALSFFPAGDGKPIQPLLIVDDPAVQLATFKKAETSEDYILRLFEPTGQARQVGLTFPGLGLRRRVAIGSFEIKTLKLNPKTKTLTETDLLEARI